MFIITFLAPDQNRTDTNSLEGYGSTIELQARLISNIIELENTFLLEILFFSK